MNYYWLKLVRKLPHGFGSTAQGPIIKLLTKYKDDVGLVKHEKTHVRQWYAVLGVGFLLCTLLLLFVSTALWPLYGAAPFLHQLLYRFARPYRRWCEVRAYRKQIATGDYISNDFAVTVLLKKYDLRLGVHEARVLLIS